MPTPCIIHCGCWLRAESFPTIHYIVLRKINRVLDRNKPYTKPLAFIDLRTQNSKKQIKMTNNKKENKGNILISAGSLFIIIGIVAMAMKSSNFIILPCLIIGIMITAYGIISTGKSKKINDK